MTSSGSQDARSRQREVSNSPLSTLLNSLTMDQLRTALAFIYKSGAPSSRTKEEAAKQIASCGQSEDSLTELLLRIEAETPTRHCLVTKFSGSALPFVGRQVFQTEQGLLDFSLVSQMKRESLVISTFEHEVEITEWRQVDKDSKRRETHRIRHPVILKQDLNSKIAQFCFPGFSTGSGDAADRLSSKQAIGLIIRSLSRAFPIRFEPFVVEDALISLQDAPQPRARVVRSDFDAAHGRFTLATPSRGKSVDDLFTDLLAPFIKDVSANNIKKAFRDAVREASPNSLVVAWIQEQVVTRIQFWDIGAELMFVWHGTPASLVTIDTIVRLIVSVSEEIETPPKRDAWSILAALKSGEIITPYALQSRSKATEEEARRAIIRALDIGVLRPVYRLRTASLVVDWPNDWTTELSELKREFKLEGGSKLDGTNPENLEVAFQSSAAANT